MFDSKREQLIKLAEVIESHSGWWRFPDEEAVQGFLGTDPIFIVGIRPSTSEWGPSHPHRRFFYDFLAKIGAANAHLTDIYKRRGHSNDVEVESEKDFNDHLLLFRKEIEILRPTRIISMGVESRNRLRWHMPELESIVKEEWHYMYAIRSGRRSEYELKMRAAIEGCN
ncbi:MAG TPA: hypothetical protein VF779_21070 [Pyrinomonadaceae bacterium]